MRAFVLHAFALTIYLIHPFGDSPTRGDCRGQQQSFLGRTAGFSNSPIATSKELYHNAKNH